jgi:triacylglycerol lipase
MRKLLLAALLALAVLGMRPLTDSPSTTEASHVDPILFVHGFTGSSSAWNTMAPRFQADGWHGNQLFGHHLQQLPV